MNKVLQAISALFVIGLAVYPFLTSNQKVSQKVQPKQDAKQKIVAEQPKKVQVSLSPLPEFGKIYDVKQKKTQFFSYLLPYVNLVNQEIKLEREFLLKLSQRPQFPKALSRFEKIAKKYRTDTEQDFNILRSQLLRRVDLLPVELVLMQAANESAWGTSRFAVKANNLFGQWCFKKGCGVVPEDRPQGKSYEVRKFNHPLDSVRSYFHNLNTGWAYTDLRQLREIFRQNQQLLDASVIAQGLIPYSTRREAYVKEIQAMIRVNKKYIKNENKI